MLFRSGMKEAQSYGINGQYYFSNKDFRPFVGIGLGFFHPILHSDPFYGYTSRLEETVIGFYPRLGFDYGHLSIAIDMNVVASSNAIISRPAFEPSFNGTLNSNYLSMKVGIVMGGGRKNK